MQPSEPDEVAPPKEPLDPLSSVVLGAGKMLSDFNLLRRICLE